MLRTLPLERITRLIRNLLVILTVSYAVLTVSTIGVQLEEGCNNNECRTRIFQEGSEQYCTDPGTVAGSRCVKTGSKCYTDYCVFLD